MRVASKRPQAMDQASRASPRFWLEKDSPEQESYQNASWTITTANATSWKSGQLMLETIPCSDFWAIQETHLSGRGRLATAQRWERSKGWATFFQEAEESGQHESGQPRRSGAGGAAAR